ncbi:hypothetical protein B7R54_15135 [Subtercola boreus]|uniref:Uncharacterized protein n=1 Tax=Subtercola boreus TaxID=120213 RepID=A0A3E0VLU0_9MICO|nr:hypothetical protein [Subtercola boreus]RFA10390.1 hypothetical protein B7R54_15135 [Subtercola boreus]TQL56092.1 hypothetical protein FB464_3674 [Subtercola boreus]
MSDNRQTGLGPTKRVPWIPLTDTEITRAKQRAMLAVDVDQALTWHQTMLDLIAEELDDQDFTTRRMTALTISNRERKRAQARLHYKFDPRRRKAKLISADIAALRAKMENQAKLWRERFTPEVIAATAAAVERPATPKPRVRPSTRKAPVRREPMDEPAVFTRTLDGIDPIDIRMIKADTRLDLESATDEMVKSAYLAKGTPADVADQYVALLNGAKS